MRKLAFLLLITMAASPAQALLADHVASAEFENIPESYFQDIRDHYNFFYGHTSHGSQIMTGLDILEDADPILYDQPYFHEISDDLGHNGDTSWVAPTENWLDAHPECNVVMWSWCGGCSDNTEAGINTYLAAMEGLEADYPDVIFIYMTGHLNGTGIDGNLYARNNQIRQYCEDHDKVLFDFADIESWDPDGNYYPDESDGCSWCYDWCAIHECPSCAGCAHSHCFNCYLKGKAFWWMMARLDGWQATGVNELPTSTWASMSVWPNPFNPGTRIRVDLPEASTLSMVIYDLAGRKVRTLHEGWCEQGIQNFRWDGRDGAGRVQESGVFFCRLTYGNRETSCKLTLLK